MLTTLPEIKTLPYLLISVTLLLKLELIIIFPVVYITHPSLFCVEPEIFPPEILTFPEPPFSTTIFPIYDVPVLLA